MTSKVTNFLDERFLTTPKPVNNSSACYIATVCYGNNMAPEVIRFREFRDNYLKSNYLGRKFIVFYYCNAERISRKLEKKPFTNKLIRIIILNPIYKLIK